MTATAATAVDGAAADEDTDAGPSGRMACEEVGVARRHVLGALVAGAVATAAVRRSLLVVRGPSMRPTLEAGDVVVTLPLPDAPPLPRAWRDRWRDRWLTPGRIVVLADPARPDHRIVKRIAAVHPDGLEVRGDDPGWSIDSRVFGRVPRAQVRRVVLARWSWRRPGLSAPPRHDAPPPPQPSASDA